MYKRPSISSHHHAAIIIIIIITKLSNSSCQYIPIHIENRRNEQSNMPNPNRSTRGNVSNCPPKDVLSGRGEACNLWGPVAVEECNKLLKREAVHSPSFTNKPSGMCTWLKVSDVRTLKNISVSNTHTHTEREYGWLIIALAPAQLLKVKLLTVSISTSPCRVVQW